MLTFNNLTDWLKGHVLLLVLLFVGIMILTRAHKGDHKGALVTVGCVLVGLFIIGLALSPGAVTTLSTDLVNLVVQ